MISDNIAEKLEAAGILRRAARRWLDVMLQAWLSDAEREQVRQRRKHCLSRVTPVMPPEKLAVADIARAATAAQVRMGLSRPGGAAFRMKEDAGRAVTGRRPGPAVLTGAQRKV